MSREWFRVVRQPLNEAQRDAFADPLEGEDWQGLGWVVPMLSWMTGAGRPVSGVNRVRITHAAAKRPANA